MKKTGIIFLIFAIFFQLLPVSAHGVTANSCHTLQAGSPIAGNEAYTGTANAVLLYECNSQTLVYGHDMDEKINPTGLVKLLTALIVLEEGKLEDVVTVKRSTLNSVAPGAVSAGLKAGEEIALKDLLYCVMVASANDAAAVMAEHVAGSQSAFVEKMNARAATLGCVNTHFTNVHGLQDDSQYSTARDLAIIVEEALKNEQFTYFFGITGYTVPATNSSGTRKLSTTNYMMDQSSKYYDARVTGGKPAAATSSDRSMICTAQVEDCRYLCVVISAKARMSGGAVTRYTNFDEAQDLLDLGFDGFAIQQVMGTEQPFDLYPVSGGENHVVVGPDAEVFALLPVKFDAAQLRFQDVRQEQRLVAPLAAGTAVGTLQIFYGSILIGEVNLQARHDVAAAGTTVRTDNTQKSGSLFGRILKWGAIVLLGLLMTGMAVLLILRRINLRRHQKQRRANRQERREV